MLLPLCVLLVLRDVGRDPIDDVLLLTAGSFETIEDRLQEIIGPNTTTGVLGRSGIINTDANGRYEASERRPTQAGLVVVMGCNSNQLRDAFAGATNYIGVNGGADQGSSTYGLNQGIIETAKTIVDANGVINQQTLNNIVQNTQRVIRENTAQGTPDPDDRVILNPAIRVPTAGRRVP